MIHQLGKLAFVSILLFQGCVSVDKNLPPQPTVSHVELPRFMGRWYVIASIPTMFEKGAYNATETYTWNQEKNRVDIDFRYNKNAFDGPEKKIPQKGFVYNQTTKAEWRVQPIWPLKFAYLIIDLAKDYSDTVVGVPNRQYVWIMARQKTMTDVRYNELVKKLESLGYDIAKLQKVPQR